MNVLVWIRRDLRVEDHPALALAAMMGAVLPLFVVEPAVWAAPDRSARQWGFVAECLAELREGLGALGAPLVVRVGAAETVLERLCKTHGITRIVSISETVGAAEAARDARVAAWARTAGVEWVQVGAGPGQVTGLTPVAAVEPGLIPTARALRLAEDRAAHRQLGGRARGEAVLASFLSARGRAYRAERDLAGAGERAGSRLSPYLAWGVLSAGEVAAAVAARRAERPGWGRSLSAFGAALALREGAAGALPGHSVSEPERLAAWAAGQTGVPFVDAAMRYLAATGWLNARMRAMVAGFALHHLGLGARSVGEVLARLSVDYAPEIHWRALGEVAAARAVDPLRLAATLDAGNGFTRAWLPELARVPEPLVQTPWRWSGANGLLGRRYPEALVDPIAALKGLRVTTDRKARRGIVVAGQMSLML
jgi:deoxyribodipyrimidine photo-lyase